MKPWHRRKASHFFLIFILWLLACSGKPAFANNLAVANVSLTNRDTVNHYYDIQLDISWNNSWFISGAPSATANWDAAWVFVKYSTYSGGVWSDWKHCTLLNTGYTAPTGSQMSFGITDTAYKGVFIYRSAAGSGSVNWTGAKISWNYGTDGVSDSATIKVKVFAIEMVYIPQGNFYVGSGGTETSAFYKYPTTTNAYSISSEDAINVGATTDYLYYPLSTYGGDQLGPIPAAFPKGYNAFYIMKYDISQKQYADFLNTLTSSQASSRNPGASTYRYTISGSWPNFSASRPDRSCNWLQWADIFAYADWAALRPFTELEFEKACRGGQTPVANEYAWGLSDSPTTTAIAATTISGTEDGTETITLPAGANSCFGNKTFTNGDAGQGPLRCGIFATGSSTRTTSGAGYYGVMELSGNLWERPVTVGNPEGRAFTGTHGDGDLTTTPSGWPSSSTATGVGFRGGTWGDGATYARVSDRYYAANADASRDRNLGGRCARTSP